MRIVSGMYHGRPIDAPAGDGTRPTTDRVREALMSSLISLRGGLEGARVLDAFAGSGALGIEALSRGARSAVFFERERTAQRAVEHNLARLCIDARTARLVRRDFFKTTLVADGSPFDLVFLDPPYALDAETVLARIASLLHAGVISADAIVVYEHAIADAAHVAAAGEAHGFLTSVVKKYGKTGVTMFTTPAQARR